MSASAVAYPSVVSLPRDAAAPRKRAYPGYSCSAPPPSPKRARAAAVPSTRAPSSGKRARPQPMEVDEEIGGGGAVGGLAKRARHALPSEAERLPAAAVFPWSRQAAWRSTVEVLPAHEPWAQRVVADLDRDGPDTPLVTARELRALLQRARDEGEARGRRRAEQQLESQRQNLLRLFQQQHLRQSGVLPPPPADYRASYIC